MFFLSRQNKALKKLIWFIEIQLKKEQLKSLTLIEFHDDHLIQLRSSYTLTLFYNLNLNVPNNYISILGYYLCSFLLRLLFFLEVIKSVNRVNIF